MRLPTRDEARQLPYIGGGYFSSVYDLGQSHVVKLIDNYWLGRRPTSNDSGDENGGLADDMSWLVWCHKRLLRYGARSVEMKGLPLVFAIDAKTGVAVMSRLRPIYEGGWTDTEAREKADNWTGTGCGERLCPEAYAVLRKHFKGVPSFDDHAANVMWCPVREEYVLNDPLARLPTKVKPPVKKASASWKPRYGRIH